MAMARMLLTPFSWCSKPLPTYTATCGADPAMARAMARIVAAGTPDSSSTASGVYALAYSTTLGKPRV